MHKLFQSVPVSVRPFLSVTLIVIAFVFAIISGCSHWYGMTQEKNGMRVTTLFNWDGMYCTDVIQRYIGLNMFTVVMMYAIICIDV